MAFSSRSLAGNIGGVLVVTRTETLGFIQPSCSVPQFNRNPDVMEVGYTGVRLSTRCLDLLLFNRLGKLPSRVDGRRAQLCGEYD